MNKYTLSITFHGQCQSVANLFGKETKGFELESVFAN